MATCKDYFDCLSDEEVDLSLSSQHTSEMEDYVEDSHGLNPLLEEDEELRELVNRLKNKAKIAHLEPDYCFPNDPTWAPGDVRPGPEPDPENRLTDLGWCHCNNCTLMESVSESLCYTEIEEIDCVKESCDVCITEHSSFPCSCTEPQSLIRVLINTTNSTRRRLDPSSNGFLRLAAYHSFTMWIYGILVKHKRRVIPSCVIKKNCERFPDPKGRYTGFHYYEDIPLSNMDLDLNF